MKIDSHAHVFLKSLPMIETRRYTPNYDATPEEYFSLLKSQGLNGGLLVQPSFLGTDNSYLLSALDAAKLKEPQLVVKGVAVLDPTIPTAEMLSLKQSGITGVRLNCISRTMPEFDSKLVKSFLRRVDALGWHVEIQIEGRRLHDALDKLVLTNKRIVIDHFGLPDSSSRNYDFDSLLKNKDLEVCMKISAPYRVFSQLPLEESVKQCTELTSILLDTLGSERLIWGSDWPWTQHQKGQSYQDTLLWAKEWNPNQDYHAGYVPDWLLNLS